MHVVMFGDQHLESLGGAQVSMRLQRQFLERAGHAVTVVAPAMHRRGVNRTPSDAAYIDLPSVPITLDREYSFTWPGHRADRFVDVALATRPPIDLVHVQADFWGAFIGYRFAQRHHLPVVHTMHNRVDVGIEAVAPFPKLVLRVLNAWERHALPKTPVPMRAGADGWSYLARMAARADAVTAPSSHFANRLEQHGVFPTVDVVWNGIDDGMLDSLRAEGAEGTRSPGSDAVARPPGPPRLIWVGRMSPEKRLLPFLHAAAEAGIHADIEVIGSGGQLGAARRLIEKLQPVASVRLSGRVPYADVLHRIAAADAVVQTSIGFETQGMTVFEAATLGTPAVVSDPDIGRELQTGFWQVADDSTAALAATLRQAAADIAAGSAPMPNPDVAADFRQSSRTAAMVEIYDRVVGTRPGA